MNGATVPKTPVDEDCHALGLEDKVRPNYQVSPAFALGNPRPQRQLDDKVAPPALDASAPEGTGQRQLCGPVALAPDSGHYLRTFGWAKDVCHLTRTLATTARRSLLAAWLPHLASWQPSTPRLNRGAARRPHCPRLAAGFQQLRQG